MLFLFLFFDQTVSFFKSKRYLVVLILVLVIIFYTILGGIGFHLMEKRTADKNRLDAESQVQACLKTHRGLRENQLFQTCVAGHFEKATWNIPDAILFAFGSITTAGYGGLTPSTVGGRLFYIFYCLIGMPLTLLCLANIGQFIEEFLGIAIKKYKKMCKNKHKKSMTGNKDDEDKHAPKFEMSGVWLLILFGIYIAIGVVALIVHKDLHWSHSLFINFNSMTAIDATEILTSQSFYFPISVTYVTGGLALATIAVNVLGKYLRTLHYLGMKLKNSGNTVIHFGGKDLTVDEFTKAVADQWGIDQDQIDALDLDAMVEHRLEEREQAITEAKRARLIRRRIRMNKVSVPQTRKQKDRKTTFAENRRKAIRKNSMKEQGRAEYKMDPHKLHEAYQIEWERKEQKLKEKREGKTPESGGPSTPNATQVEVVEEIEEIEEVVIVDDPQNEDQQKPRTTESKKPQTAESKIEENEKEKDDKFEEQDQNEEQKPAIAKNDDGCVLEDIV